MFAASDIREHMEVVGADGRHVGTVDRLDGDSQIKLTRDDLYYGEHHYLAVDLIERVDDKIHLKIPAQDAKFQIQ